MNDAAAAGVWGLIAMLWVGALGFALAVHLLMGYCFKLMALKAGNDEDAKLWWIPFVNMLIPIRITGRPDWWLALLFFVPMVNIILLFIIFVEVAQSLGKPAVWGVLSVLFPFIGLPYLAFSKDEYSSLHDGEDIVIRLPD